MPRLRQARGRRLPLVAVVCALAVLLAGVAGDRADAANVVVLFTTPSSSNLWVGGSPIVVAEEIAPVGDPGLGSFDLEVTYNPAVLNVSVREGPFLSSTGNETTCATGGAEGDLEFSCSVLGQPAAGPTGRGVLAYFDISPRPALGLRATAGNGVLAHMEDVLKLSTAADVQGSPIAVMDGARTFIVVRRLVGDVNKDCKVDLLDDQAISARFPSTFGTLAYDPQYDLEPSIGDGDIDVKDTQLVFGRNGNTCDQPGPSETPPPEETPTIPATSTPTPPRTPTSTPTPEGSSTLTPTAVTTGVATSTPVPTRTSMRTPTPGGTRTATAGGTHTPSADDVNTEGDEDGWNRSHARAGDDGDGDAWGRRIARGERADASTEVPTADRARAERGQGSPVGRDLVVRADRCGGGGVAAGRGAVGAALGAGDACRYTLAS